MEHHPDLVEIHDLYQRRVAKALAAVGLIHIDLTIPAQSQIADKVMGGLSLELNLLAEK